MGRRIPLAGVGQQTHQPGSIRQGKNGARVVSGVVKTTAKTAQAPISAVERRQVGLRRALARLEREHVALLLALCELSQSSQTDRSQESQLTTSQALRAALTPMIHDDLRQTQYALARAAQGLYGVCERCGHTIPLRRLEMRPNATTCERCEIRR
ncbi:MAG TPA: TraR/DksA C4-type zinc finger protein [Ktedonobacterales bacterium]|nr:TraR/DksA C4-type zinc finger protein [Ktedonobacterales bacterium]